MSERKKGRQKDGGWRRRIWKVGRQYDNQMIAPNKGKLVKDRDEGGGGRGGYFLDCANGRGLTGDRMKEIMT